jgi:large subunit ribosomal protein L25
LCGDGEWKCRKRKNLFAFVGGMPMPRPFSCIEKQFSLNPDDMKQIPLKCTAREASGRTASRQQRQGGHIPAVIYGESGTRHLTVNAHEFKLAYRTFSGSAALIELQPEEGESTFAVIQELQRNTRTDAFLHIDFREIVRGKEMEADIPVKTKGTADGVRNYGGVLEVNTHAIRVRCRPRNLPEAVVIDVTRLGIGQSLHLSDLEAGEGVTYLGDREQVIVSCVGASGGSGGAEAEATAEATAS